MGKWVRETTKDGGYRLRRTYGADVEIPAETYERVAEIASGTDYESLKKDELVTLADERGVDSSGTKADIAARLKAADGD